MDIGGKMKLRIGHPVGFGGTHSWESMLRLYREQLRFDETKHQLSQYTNTVAYHYYFWNIIYCPIVLIFFKELFIFIYMSKL